MSSWGALAGVGEAYPAHMPGTRVHFPGGPLNWTSRLAPTYQPSEQGEFQLALGPTGYWYGAWSRTNRRVWLQTFFDSYAGDPGSCPGRASEQVDRPPYANPQNRVRVPISTWSDRIWCLVQNQPTCLATDVFRLVCLTHVSQPSRIIKFGYYGLLLTYAVQC